MMAITNCAATPTPTPCPPATQKGQASLLMVMMLIPAFMLLAFVINVGMLVHAKINLQSTADLAAYTGAAAQARTLNHISHLNYLMRMNYKKFLFKYYVLGNMGQKCFPGTAGSASAACARRVDLSRNFDFVNPATNPQDWFPKVPAVCAYYDNRANICQLSSELSRNLVVRQLPCRPGDTACPALNSQLEQIRDIQRADCATHGQINMKLLLAWLYNTNANPSTNAIANAEMVQGMMQDLGLVPANLFLDARIRNLTRYINQPRASNVTAATISSFEGALDQASRERTILAYRTAEGNLAAGGSGDGSWGTFEPGTMILDELVGGGARQADLLTLNRIYLPDPGFSVFYTYSGDQDPLGGVSTVANNSSASSLSCAAFLGEFTVSSRVLPFGVYKDPRTRVYYAVRLRAKAKLLFSPFEDLELTAFSAAAPFGSRIGPKINPQDLVMSYRVGIKRVNSTQVDEVDRLVPNLPFDSEGHTYANAGLLKSLFESLRATTNSRTGIAVDTASAKRGWEIAMGPDPIEIGQYNIPIEAGATSPDSLDRNTGVATSTKTNLFTNYFSTQQVYRLWAPVFPLEADGQSQPTARDLILAALEESFGVSATAAPGSGDGRSVLRGSLGDALDAYVGLLSSAGGSALEYNETVNVAAMPNPLKYPVAVASIGAGPGASPRKVTDPVEISTSWWNQKWVNLGQAFGGGSTYSGYPAREGYSVKLVPFSSVVRGGQQMLTSNIPTLERPWVGVSPGEFGGDAAADLPRLRY